MLFLSVFGIRSNYYFKVLNTMQCPLYLYIKYGSICDEWLILLHVFFSLKNCFCFSFFTFKLLSCNFCLFLYFEVFITSKSQFLYAVSSLIARTFISTLHLRRTFSRVPFIVRSCINTRALLLWHLVLFLPMLIL